MERPYWAFNWGSEAMLASPKHPQEKLVEYWWLCSLASLGVLFPSKSSNLEWQVLWHYGFYGDLAIVAASNALHLKIAAKSSQWWIVEEHWRPLLKYQTWIFNAASQCGIELSCGLSIVHVEFSLCNSFLRFFLEYQWGRSSKGSNLNWVVGHSRSIPVSRKGPEVFPGCFSRMCVRPPISSPMCVARNPSNTSGLSFSRSTHKQVSIWMGHKSLFFKSSTKLFVFVEE